jgi:F-type H+-transporting ATPase subunit b
MDVLLEKLGIDWRLFLSQAVNFLILLVVLRLTVYKPLLALLHKRRQVIEEGVEKAKEADKRLGAISELQKEKLKEAEGKAVVLIKNAEEKAKAEGQKLLADAARREQELVEKAKRRAQDEREEVLGKARGEAVEMVKNILIKAVGVSPKAVDEALIEKIAAEK